MLNLTPILVIFWGIKSLNEFPSSFQYLGSSLINNTMLIQISIFAWLFLGKNMTPKRCSRIILAFIGILLVQIKQRKKVVA